MVRIKRVYEGASPRDGRRILVDRLWPRGIKKENAALDEWLKEIAPSNELRKWFGHDPSRWQEFRKQYKKELAAKHELIEKLRREAAAGRGVTLLYAARDEVHNNAVVLKEEISGSNG